MGTPLKRLRLLFILMIFLAIAIRIVVTIYYNGYSLFNYSMLPTTFDCFGFGALLALLKEVNPTLLNKIFRHKYFIALGILLAILNNKFGSVLTQQAFGKTIFAFVSFYLVGIAATIRFKSISRLILENKAIMYFGRISYGMYVYHLLIWGSFGKYFTNFWHWLHFTNTVYKSFFEFVFILICTILVAGLSYELFEKRFLYLKKYISFAK
jgi:peptidoglycan/LPS O-acetylase OafA/YrhL